MLCPQTPEASARLLYWGHHPVRKATRNNRLDNLLRHLKLAAALFDGDRFKKLRLDAIKTFL
jgi:hypothetical protein